MHKVFDINSLDRIAIVGVGLLGGSIGLALRAAGFSGVRVGVGRRASSLERALACEAVDETTCDTATGITGAQLVILCTPIGRFEGLLREMKSALAPGSYVTDVASTKTEVVRLAQRLLPKNVHFVGSHPMAGSEKTGVEYARADLFENAPCLVTPTPKTPAVDVEWICSFWDLLGGLTLTLPPARHDALLARVSHLPHAVATALVGLSLHESAIDLAGPGFADTTRIASGDPQMWTEIFQTNRRALIAALDRLMGELNRFRDRLSNGDTEAILQWLSHSKQARDQWLTERYRRKVLPS
ncbi:MAG: prephenate dehydrogenase/arogenate dehydrogenase family protein [Phycisphaerales bacterium]|nr:prephenate dehydrogenase/arogenate dehydrogenase family protein [Phycisphaerales bacterium]